MKTVKCEKCKGQGQHIVPAHTPEGTTYEAVTCRRCGGTGRLQQPKKQKP